MTQSHEDDNDIPSGFHHGLVLARLLVETLVRFEYLYHSCRHGMLCCRILDIWPERQFGVGAHLWEELC
jgi:hypothetical protein